MAATTTVRVHISTRDALSRISARRGISTLDLLAELVECSEQDELLDQMNASFVRQRADTDAWTKEMAERSAWDRTLIDGLAEL